MVNGCCAPKCRYTHMSCYDCPTKSCELSSIQKINLRKINRQVRQDSSLAIMKRRVAMISKQVGGGANPSSLAQAGGLGDLTSAIQNAVEMVIPIMMVNAPIVCFKNILEFKIKECLELIKNMDLMLGI